jgi:hypothetical protein
VLHLPGVLSKVLESRISVSFGKDLEVRISVSFGKILELPWFWVSAESVGRSLLGSHAMVLLPRVFSSGGFCIWADFLGFNGDVSFAPIFEVHNFDIRSSGKVLELPWFWVSAERVISLLLLGGAVFHLP